MHRGGKKPGLWGQCKISIPNALAASTVEKSSRIAWYDKRFCTDSSRWPTPSHHPDIPTHLTLYAFLKYLRTWSYVGHHGQCLRPYLCHRSFRRMAVGAVRVLYQCFPVVRNVKVTEISVRKSLWALNEGGLNRGLALNFVSNVRGVSGK